MRVVAVPFRALPCKARTRHAAVRGRCQVGWQWRCARALVPPVLSRACACLLGCRCFVGGALAPPAPPLALPCGLHTACIGRLPRVAVCAVPVPFRLAPCRGRCEDRTRRASVGGRGCAWWVWRCVCALAPPVPPRALACGRCEDRTQRAAFRGRCQAWRLALRACARAARAVPRLAVWQTQGSKTACLVRLPLVSVTAGAALGYSRRSCHLAPRRMRGLSAACRGQRPALRVAAGVGEHALACAARVLLRMADARIERGGHRSAAARGATPSRASPCGRCGDRTRRASVGGR